MLTMIVVGIGFTAAQIGLGYVLEISRPRPQRPRVYHMAAIGWKLSGRGNGRHLIGLAVMGQSGGLRST